jgi:acyl-coenzyme A thioesterase PaaI-like protein
VTEQAPAFDEATIRRALVTAVPFNELVGIEVLEVRPGRGVVLLPDAERLRNHVGSQHAGALFLAGEAAGGAAFVGAFAAEMGEITFLLRGARILYEHLARGEVLATCEIGSELARVRRELDASGRSRLTARAELTDRDGTSVCALELDYSIRHSPQADSIQEE